MSLTTELDAVSVEHRRCGNLDVGIDGATVWRELRTNSTPACRACEALAFLGSGAMA